MFAPTSDEDDFGIFVPDNSQSVFIKPGYAGRESVASEEILEEIR